LMFQILHQKFQPHPQKPYSPTPMTSSPDILPQTNDNNWPIACYSACNDERFKWWYLQVLIMVLLYQFKLCFLDKLEVFFAVQFFVWGWNDFAGVFRLLKTFVLILLNNDKYCFLRSRIYLESICLPNTDRSMFGRYVLFILVWFQQFWRSKTKIACN
jgi:hypothetical protein